MRGLLTVVMLAILPAAAGAERVVLGLSRDEVAITATFDGSSLLIFGAVQRETPIPTDSTLEVIITVTGPATAVDVRRKDRRFGIWVNTDTVHLSRAPSFYAVASTGPLPEILSATEDLRHRISMQHVLRTVGAADDVADVASFTAALERLRARDDLFQIREGSVVLDDQTLFRTSLTLPANLVEGDYRTRIFLLRDRAVVDRYETDIAVYKAGLERWLFALSREDPFLYGAMSLVIAIAAGWGASAVFRGLKG